ncbi:hypothetical protein SODALDRAFT_326938 [Sodiomyces alkalinus F11]|uniref:Cytoplasmic tRNA 2-thiolation protein 2 n=1 Tax=Sodiomyces alkalinus (strain CBS 110278 / VKM F-3762 / F11) TaxID=1314773 RepID=A0A3N2Q7M5_SODAK|nr:hypothetical protein SODALDRAFT_326938 [Sodiomyces alkalinus F11]ROT42783.1 hypothetical protein SODALDRAFT_326938 [Sodiomyces alkalinus F11]
MSDGELPCASPPCRRCKSYPATLKVRLEPVCESCYGQYITQKVVKRMVTALKEVRAAAGIDRPQAPPPPRYLVALSFGASSTGLLHILHENLRSLRERNPRVAYDLTAIHIDTDLSDHGDAAEPPDTPASRLLRTYQSRFPLASLEIVPLTAILDAPTMDWSAMPPRDSSLPPAAQVRKLLQALPSVTSRVDVLRIFVRHLLLATAVEKNCDALMLGSTTTALAELTLGAAAKGRGLAVPWLVADGPFPFPVPVAAAAAPLPSDAAPGGVVEEIAAAGVANLNTGNTRSTNNEGRTVPVYYPLRDVFRRELLAYNGMKEVALTDLVVEGESSATATVVSHKELSIEAVMARYFAEVEENQSNVIANVVRTTEKLMKVRGDQSCSVCGMTLDEQGDARWKGEIGEIGENGESHERISQETSTSARKLCYGCERSIRG